MTRWVAAPKMIYVVETEAGHIKIGISGHPESRALTIRQHSPIPCRLIAVFPGRELDERALHRSFEAFRTHGEWFGPSAETREYADKVRGLGVDVASWDSFTITSAVERRRAAWAAAAAKRKAMMATPQYKERRRLEKERAERFRAEYLAQQAAKAEKRRASRATRKRVAA